MLPRRSYSPEYDNDHQPYIPIQQCNIYLLKKTDVVLRAIRPTNHILRQENGGVLIHMLMSYSGNTTYVKYCISIKIHEKTMLPRRSYSPEYDNDHQPYIPIQQCNIYLLKKTDVVLRAIRPTNHILRQENGGVLIHMLMSYSGNTTYVKYCISIKIHEKTMLPRRSYSPEYDNDHQSYIPIQQCIYLLKKPMSY